jgi:hypothetical protein
MPHVCFPAGNFAGATARYTLPLLLPQLDAGFVAVGERDAGFFECVANGAPLAEAVDLPHALLVMGYGMIDNNEDGGRPVVAVTGAVWERLNAVRDAWREVVETAQRQMR